MDKIREFLKQRHNIRITGKKRVVLKSPFRTFRSYNPPGLTEQITFSIRLSLWNRAPKTNEYYGYN